MTTTPHPASDDPARDERFLQGIAGAGIGIWDLDLSTQKLLWSGIDQTLFGVSNDLPLTYELFLSLLETQDRKRTEHAVRLSVETGCSFDMQYRVREPSQSYRWVRVRGSVVKDEQGVPLHLNGLVIDIDDQKQVEEALRTRESHLHSILETIPDAMIVIDGSGIMQFFSSAAERQFGHAEQEAIGKNVSILMPNPDRSRHDGYLARYPSTGERHIIGIGRIVTGQRKDGTTFPMHLSIGEMQSGGAPVFHRVRPRSDRASADPSAASGTCNPNWSMFRA